MDIQKRVVIGVRPDCSPDWRIFNAPRPLPGTATWQGDFICGIFYAAVAPDDQGHDWLLQQMHDLDAKELTWVSEQHAIEASLAYYRKEYPEEAKEIDVSDPVYRRWLVDSFIDRSRSDEDDVDCPEMSCNAEDGLVTRRYGA